MKHQPSFDLSEHIPLIAIIRGVEPKNIIQTAQVLLEEGFTLIEVPLNSPDALESIQMLVNEFGDKAIVGAGTVTTLEQATAVIETGANLVVTPNFNADVVSYAAAQGCYVFPGVVTPSEAFGAIASGATGIKLFPANLVGLGGYKALKSVLPKETVCIPVGGISPTVESMKPWIEAGVSGFGLGAALYTPTMTLDEIRTNARQFVEIYRASI
ncbi:2-dehydro-3-deoxy-6-phosphogalactonate aldolase [Vibrio maritimus]|uniref:2-dehydro-3-deoxy-6-phosphogalactonate aldolase n=1 Tax=Vibrio maritimus TaxID=990268 RepID=UPI001F21A2E9|nr:2-dehydro-3-deoxy-6-phosphogalactonate aldolase [Vibrio maritimus]